MYAIKMNNTDLLLKLFVALIAGTVSLMGLLTCINPKLTQSLYINQGNNKNKITITPNLLVSRIMGFVLFIGGIIFLMLIFTQPTSLQLSTKLGLLF